jgi:UDP-4-amino-4,6-dideoxy-N-acetyl-beta-L-altrosamine N-acetyltransferase
MIIRKYGIVLRRLLQKDIELVRKKRNQDSVRNYMFYQQEITSTEQEKWFKSINNIYNYYFIIESENKKVGLINGKNINYEKRTSEGGIFIWDEDYRDIQISAIASVIMAEFTFMMFGFKKTYAEILSSNNAQIKYNEFMGYELENEKNDKLIYSLSKNNYLKKRGRLLKAIEHLTKDKTPISWGDLDFSDIEKQEIQELYVGLPHYIQNDLDRLLLNK